MLRSLVQYQVFDDMNPLSISSDALMEKELVKVNINRQFLSMIHECNCTFMNVHIFYT